MHDRGWGTFDRLERAVDEVGSGLSQHLNGDVIGDFVAFDQLTYEVEVGLRRGLGTRPRSL